VPAGHPTGAAAFLIAEMRLLSTCSHANQVRLSRKVDLFCVINRIMRSNQELDRLVFWLAPPAQWISQGSFNEADSFMRHTSLR
jgi:hypothetical protein